MNLLLLDQADLLESDVAIIRDHRLQHLLNVHRACPGDRLKAGLLNGEMGQAEILRLDGQQATLRLMLNETPPKPLPLILVLALPRPKMLRRCLGMVAELGIKQLYLINSYRVEKSYWQSPLLSPDEIHQALLRGLEQAKDTRLPQVQIRQRFKPFVEDELPGLVAGRAALVAHPYTGGAGNPPLPLSQPALVCVGPEGGFISYEVEKLQAAGCRPLALGERIYRVETVLPLLAGRLFG
ncbi:16S rRNA (uracil(1498)-N(3))-methyltransferase [Sedimenticola thiotaurini]|uniref:Ribosomal RNA small subunit methyltransferase E n=1 Tax=Sedimenticola thiotaurini TaxID=1543721 RepID=A0A0F7JZ04_9GAMM|nr:16S rRNA (uracil(1498)-N(3))-methyltransferase [Sedimenticola thiotaurini]AKH19928.1 16S rRNA methyltransferase [Sedimenticola thiotaurini]